MNKEETTAALTAARAELAGLLTEGKSLRVLGYYIDRVAELEGKLKAITDYELGNRDALITELIAGSDDAWSGRGNDIRRAIFDGYRKQANRLIK